MPRRFQRCYLADEITCTPSLCDAALRVRGELSCWFSSAFWQMLLLRRGPICFGPRPRRSSRRMPGRAASARPAPSSPPPPRTTSPGFLPTPPARCCCRCRCASGGWPQPRQVLTPLSMRELPCWAQSPCDNRRFQGSPSIPQLALVMPTGSQRRAASARLNERKCRAPATTISAMTSCRPRCVEVLCGQSGSATTACRRMADKRQIQRVGGPLSRSKSGGRVMQ